jgi:hypothetical protein
VPSTSTPETGVPSASKTWAVIAVGAASHMPPVAPSGSRSLSVTFQAGASPAFWTSRVKVPGVPNVIVAGPVLVSVSSGSTIVIGPVVPGSPGLSLASSSSIRL